MGLTNLDEKRRTLRGRRKTREKGDLRTRERDLFFLK